MNTLRLLLSLSLLGAFVSVSKAVTITGTYEPFNQEIRQRLVDYDNWAVWGNGLPTANITSGAGDYTLSLNSPDTPTARDPAAAIFFTGEGYYAGGISYVTNSAQGKGFTLSVPAQYMEGNRLDLWLFNNGPVSSVVTASDFNGVNSTVNLTPYGSFRVSFEATGLSSPLEVSMVGQGDFTSAQGQMVLGAVALAPIAVDEPHASVLLTVLAMPTTLGMYLKRRSRREQPNQSPSGAVA